MPFWESAIAPELKKGKTIFVAAHGNSIRAILKFLEGISDDDITGAGSDWRKHGTRILQSTGYVDTVVWTLRGVPAVGTM